MIKKLSIAATALVLTGLALQSAAAAGERVVSRYTSTARANSISFKDHGDVPEGAFPHKENDVVEWRGVEKDGRFTPYAIIYRLAGHDEEWNHKTRLIVIKLDKERSAVIGHAEGAKEDAEAKQIADRLRPR